MNQIGLIQTFYKGFACYLPVGEKSSILKVFSILISDQINSSESFFIYMDERLGRGFNVFFKTPHSSKSLETKISSIFEKYASDNERKYNQFQLFEMYSPFSVVPMRYINENDEILVEDDEIKSVESFLNNLSLLIFKKAGNVDFDDDNQKLEFILELLIAGVAFNQFSTKNIQQQFKVQLKSLPRYKVYLENNYGQSVDESKLDIDIFKKSLLSEENRLNLLTLFWKKNKVANVGKMFEMVFKVLNVNAQQKCYCLYVLQKITE